MQSLDYIDRGDREQDGGYLLVKELEPEVRFIHVHIVEKGDPRWDHYLYFRDTLRSNENIRKRYSNLKEALRDGKSPLVRQIINPSSPQQFEK